MENKDHSKRHGLSGFHSMCYAAVAPDYPVSGAWVYGSHAEIVAFKSTRGPVALSCDVHAVPRNGLPLFRG